MLHIVAMQKLGFEALIASRPGSERDAVCAMVAARILSPHTKQATTRWWHTTPPPEEFDGKRSTNHRLSRRQGSGHAAADLLTEAA